MIEFIVKVYNMNPVPYTRTTQRAKFSATYKKYQEWKKNVVAAFVNKTGKLPHQILSKDKKYRVDVVSYFKDKKHGDPDNIAKSVNDSIFQAPLNDKYVCGSYDFDYDKLEPRVEIKISEVLA